MKNNSTTKSTYASIDDYIARCPKDIQETLQKIRATVHEASPEAKETISYQMPAFALGGVLVYFAAFKDHIGFFPTSSGIAHFQKELTAYKTSKGTIQFPLDKPIPFDLIRKIVLFRVKENLAKAAAKKNSR
jgi:uncharacterized protein YdhG (YjbR/CyaY superfamily)